MNRLIWANAVMFIFLTGISRARGAWAEELAVPDASEMTDLSNVYVRSTVRVLGLVSVMGRFDLLFGAFKNDADTETTAVRMRIEAASVNTDDEWRDGYLRGPTFFATERYPHITFSGLCLHRGKQGAAQRVGNLSLRGRSKPVVFEIEPIVPKAGQGATAYQARTVIRRSEFGLNAMQHVISDEVEIVVAIRSGSAD